MCQEDFDPVTRVPQILPCGHTFCKVCIAHSFHSDGLVTCTNCVYTTTDLSQTITNHILLDRTSLKSNVGMDHPTKFFSNRNFDTNFYSSRTFQNVSNMNSQSNMLEEKIYDNSAKHTSPLINDFNTVLNARDFESDNRTRPFFPNRKCENVGCQKIATDEFCSEFCASQTAVRRRATPSPTPVRLNNSAHTFARITPFKTISTGKETPQAIIAKFTPNSEKANFNVSINSGISTTKKLRNQSPFISKQKCRNPACDNLRYTFGNYESEYCGKMCADRFGARFII